LPSSAESVKALKPKRKEKKKEEEKAERNGVYTAAMVACRSDGSRLLR
jgi:hypothetical protein